MDKYRKISIVGKGTFGYAVLVQSIKNKKQYIMKIIDISKMDEKQIQQALLQVHLLKVMRYPYIVTYRQSFMEKMCLCIVMDYCQGGDMFQKIAKQKELGTLFPQKQIVSWLVQILLAMNYVHDKKILHRDLKTQNIFLTSTGDIKIGDFGIARVLQHTYDCANTAIGTPYYLSPEICQQKPYNQKSDIWSLGCIFYQIATLNHAFDAQNMKSLIQKILKGTYPPLPNTYSNDLKNLLSQMLTKDPNKRPSIRKILQLPFVKAQINEIFSSTMKLHELNLKKQISPTKQLKFLDINRQQGKGEKNSVIKKRQQLLRDKKTQVPRYFDGSNFKKNHNQGQKQQKNSSFANENQKQNDRYNKSKQEISKSQNKSKKIDKNQACHKKSVYQEEETLQQQGYGILIQDMKRCIKGEVPTKGQEKNEKIQDNLVSKFLEINKVPGVCQKDSLGTKIQSLRAYLQKKIGQNQFLKAYSIINQDSEDEDYLKVRKFLGPQKSNYIPLIIQLIVCEQNYY